MTVAGPGKKRARQRKARQRNRNPTVTIWMDFIGLIGFIRECSFTTRSARLNWATDGRKEKSLGVSKSSILGSGWCFGEEIGI